jgi:hypothetical protein
VRRFVLTAVLAIALSLAAGATAVAPVQTAKLRVTKLAPLTVRGAQFKPAERVRLVLTTGAERFVRRVAAGPTGRFRAIFRNVTVDRCSGYGLTARGSGGSRVVLKVTPKCPPA